MTQPASSPVPVAPGETDLTDPASAHPHGETPAIAPPPQAAIAPPSGSYVKLAMRNMVRKRRQSLVHFSLTTIGLLAFLVGISYLTR